MNVSIKKLSEIFEEAAKIKGLSEKFDLAVKRNSDKLKPVFEEFQQQVEDARIDHCSVDERHNIIRDGQGHYVYTKENLKAYNAAVAALRVKEFEFHPYFAAELPELSEAQMDLFKGFFIEMPGHNQEKAYIESTNP